MRIGILGGSFNPPHRGHLALARTVLDLGLADAIKLVPAAIPPHKSVPSEADAATRSAMTKLLAGEDDRLEIDDIELRRSGPSFSVDTVRQLTAARPGDAFRLLIGSDMAKTFATWRDYRTLLRLAPPLVAERPDSAFTGAPERQYPGMSEEETAAMQAGRFDMRPVDISSTMVRRLLREGTADEAMLCYLTMPVLRFIREHGLYRSSG